MLQHGASNDLAQQRALQSAAFHEAPQYRRKHLLVAIGGVSPLRARERQTGTGHDSDAAKGGSN